MNAFKYGFSTVLVIGSFFLTACHIYDDDEYEYPPEIVAETDIDTITAAENTDEEIDQINSAPYPHLGIQPGDSFIMKDYSDEDTLKTYPITTVVSQDGYLALGMADPVHVQGLSLLEAQKKLNESLSKYVKEPRVTLYPVAFVGEQASILGAVKVPGSFQVNENVRLTNMYGFANGSAMGSIVDDFSSVTELADLSNSKIFRNGKALPISVKDAIQGGNQRHNVRIFPGDVVWIASRKDSKVYVMGEVVMPRAMSWDANVDVLLALSNANGLKETYWSSAFILRRDPNTNIIKVLKFNIEDVLSGKAPNYKLASGDILYFPKDRITEYNIIVKNVLPTAQLLNLLSSPAGYWYNTGVTNRF